MNVLASQMLPPGELIALEIYEGQLFENILDSYRRHFQERLQNSGIRPSELELTLRIDGSSQPNVFVRHSFSKHSLPSDYRMLLGFQDEMTMEDAFAKTAGLAQKWREIGVPGTNISLAAPLHYLAQMIADSPALSLSSRSDLRDSRNIFSLPATEENLRKLRL